MRWIVPMLIVAASCGSSGSSGSAMTTTDDAAANDATTTPVQTQPVGFSTTRAVVTAADGTECELCVWLADSAQQRRDGLMFVTDLGDVDAMAFRYPRSHTGTFWMKNTVMPLSIAFFAPDGAYLHAFDMPPCVSSTCPRYATPEDFLIALEVPAGELPTHGVGPGSSLELLDLPCE